MNLKDIITIEPGKRGGKPCIRGMRITVDDVLEYLASGTRFEEILKDFPYLTQEYIFACLIYAAEVCRTYRPLAQRALGLAKMSYLHLTKSCMKKAGSIMKINGRGLCLIFIV
jgi:uncharacterized protein (DUF433 family)